MYFIKKITVDDKDKYLSSTIVEYTFKTIANALMLIEEHIRNYIVSKCGVEAGEKFAIIDIHNFSQINEPSVNSIIVYRLSADPHRFHLYERSTKTIPGTIYGYSIISEFSKIAIFELEEFDQGKNTDSIEPDTENDALIPRIDWVSVGPNRTIRIPKMMTVSPMCDVIVELKANERFQKRYTTVCM